MHLNSLLKNVLHKPFEIMLLYRMWLDTYITMLLKFNLEHNMLLSVGLPQDEPTT